MPLSRLSWWRSWSSIWGTVPRVRFTVTNLETDGRAVVLVRAVHRHEPGDRRPGGGIGSVLQQAGHCRAAVDQENKQTVKIRLSWMPSDPGSSLRECALVLPARIDNGSLTSLQQRLVKMEGDV